MELLLDTDADGDYTDGDATPVLVDTFTVDANAYRDLEPEHDKAGNLTFDGRQRYTYDAWNRLVEIAYAFKDANHDSGNLTSHGKVSEYRYDGTNRRIEKKVYVGGIHDGTEHFYYTGWSTVETRNGSGQVIQQHVWDSLAGHYIDSLAQVGNNANPGVDDDAGTSGTQDYVDNVYYTLQDQQFNVLAIVDDTGAVVERYEYTLYGERTVMNAGFTVIGESKYKLAMGFQGLRHDEESGLIENRNRVYSPVTGRFIQRDPLGYPDGMNGYAAYHVMWGGVDPYGNELLIHEMGQTNPATYEEGVDWLARALKKRIEKDEKFLERMNKFAKGIGGEASWNWIDVSFKVVKGSLPAAAEADDTIFTIVDGNATCRLVMRAKLRTASFVVFVQGVTPMLKDLKRADVVSSLNEHTVAEWYKQSPIYSFESASVHEYRHEEQYIGSGKKGFEDIVDQINKLFANAGQAPATLQDLNKLADRLNKHEQANDTWRKRLITATDVHFRKNYSAEVATLNKGEENEEVVTVPAGEIDATEAAQDYLREVFNIQ